MSPKTHELRRVQRIDRPLSEIFEFFSDAGNLEAITPRFLKFRISTPQPIRMHAGTRIEYSLSLGGVPVHWVTLITCWEPPHRFVDEQLSGPFAIWRHRHEFEDKGAFVLMHDHVEYREPLGWLGALAHQLFVARMLERIFDHRNATIASLFPVAKSRR